MSRRTSDARRTNVLHVVSSLTGGGTERALVRLLGAWPRDDGRHEVVTLRSAGSGAALLPDHVACRALGAVGRSRRSAWQLRRLVGCRRPAIVHARNTCTWADAIAACALVPGVRLVLAFHGLDHDGPFSPKQRRLARLGVWLGARFVSVSQAGVSQLVNEAGVPERRITWLGNGVDLSVHRPADGAQRRATRQALGLAEDDVVVGTVGALTLVKGHDILCRALAEVARRASSVRLLVVGDGTERSRLDQLAGTLGVQDRVRFLGQRDDVGRLLGAMDIYACPSRSEGTSNSVLEAMACGKPVVASDVGDNSILVRDGRQGRLVAPGSVTDLVEALLEMCADDACRRRCGQAALARARQYSLPGMVEAYQAYYRRLIQLHSRSEDVESTSGRGGVFPAVVR